MLFHFLGLAFLESCLFSLVCASPMKEYLKIVDDASSFSPPPRRQPVRFSPYQKHQDTIPSTSRHQRYQDPIPSTFRCPNGQAIDEKIVHHLMFVLSHIGMAELRIGNIKVEKLSIDERYDTFIYPISYDELIVQQSARKDSSTGYELIINQVKRPPFKRHFGGVYVKSGTERLKCPYTPLLVNPFDSSIFKEHGRKAFDCNGALFHPHHVEMSMLAAKKTLHEGFIGLQLTLHPTAREGFPIEFKSGIFNVDDTWMFPILPGANSVYNSGDPGTHFVIITGTGKPVGVVYLKSQEQYLEETTRSKIWTETPIVHKYGVCEVKM